MKIKDLIQHLEKFDGELEVMGCHEEVGEYFPYEDSLGGTMRLEEKVSTYGYGGKHSYKYLAPTFDPKKGKEYFII